MIEKLDKTVRFGSKEATITDIHNSLVPYYNKVNELIEQSNRQDEAILEIVRILNATHYNGIKEMIEPILSPSSEPKS